MSTSYLDWTSVGLHSHPIPGDPAVVQATAGAFRQTATRLGDAANGLRRLDSTETESLAVTKLLSNAREVAGLLELALDRYDVAADALAAYGPVQAEAKAKAEAAVRDAMTARGVHDRAAANANNLRLGAMTTIDPQQRQDFLQAYHQAKAQAADASSSYESARARVLGAIEERDRAAAHATRQISGAIADREINDDLFDQLGELWEGVKDLAAEVAKSPLLKAAIDAAIAAATWVWENIDLIVLVLTVVAFAISWVPVLGQVAVAIALAARVAVTIAKVIHAAKFAIAVAKGVRTGDYRDLVKEGAMLLLGKALGKGANKLVEKGMAQVGKKAVQGLIKESVKQTRSYRTANNTLFGGGKTTPTYHPGHDLAGDLFGRNDIARRADGLISTFKGTDFTPHVRDLAHLAQVSQSDPVQGVVNEVVDRAIVDPVKDQVIEPLVDRAVDQLPPPRSGEHRMAQVPCGPGGSVW
jgi:hypothetical protein